MIYDARRTQSASKMAFHFALDFEVIYDLVDLDFCYGLWMMSKADVGDVCAAEIDLSYETPVASHMIAARLRLPRLCSPSPWADDFGTWNLACNIGNRCRAWAKGWMLLEEGMAHFELV